MAIAKYPAMLTPRPKQTWEHNARADIYIVTDFANSTAPYRDPFDVLLRLRCPLRAGRIVGESKPVLPLEGAGRDP